MLSIGPHSHPSHVVVAPMAGITDRPFRDLCRHLGTHWLVSEMVTSDMSLWHTSKSKARLAHNDESGISWIQLIGADAESMAAAARENVRQGAQIIDINMGCPAKKVCSKLAGSALLRDEDLAEDILERTVEAVDVPVTLKMRLGWSRDEINAVTIARIAEAAGVKLITVHGRTRACRFRGEVDYEAIGRVKAAVSIPVLANGDIDSPERAKSVLASTGADGVMIGRAAQGRPWLPVQIDDYLVTGDYRPDPDRHQVSALLSRHISALHEFYGERQGVRIARKHVGWTLDGLYGGEILKRRFNQISEAGQQLALISGIDKLPRVA
ncbi:MAG: tRNA dihydrouridine synthase DusB [Gammaproteobacteria bacterium]|jgi:tRNA-dihydrouridine synthase B|nr:tRNA dihydrouridine synthase DusB [Gammaproteobacteria bacterium]MBT4494799.1 tRNA dihydrouridine synthase DusB [Gammaproteobacteria bacterium]MBT7370717.1 tRNA dihydrouridine synthase DusB [Gammaproteobacteria bacterium]